MQKSKFETAIETNAAIREIFLNRSALAQASEYDRSVCIRAVSVARDAFNTVPVSGTAEDYVGAVIDALTHVFETYRDTDGVYTSGKSSIGDVLSDVRGLHEEIARAQTSRSESQ